LASTNQTEDVTDYLVTIGGVGGRGVEVTPIGRKNDTLCRISDPFGGKDVEKPSAVYTSLGIVVCGGVKSGYASNTCTRLDTSNNNWVPFFNLTRNRYRFTMNNLNGRILAIGGGSSASTSSEDVNVKTGTKWIERSLGLNLKEHCSVGISENSLIITGGYQPLSGSYSRKTSFVTYSSEVDSWEVISGPMMKQARAQHGCAVANFKGTLTAFVVGGYNDNDHYLDSVEVFNLKGYEWKTLQSKLPFPLSSLQVVTARSLKYHIYAVGGYTKHRPVATIYGLNTSVEWEHVDDLKHARSAHSTINMQLKDIPGCQ